MSGFAPICERAFRALIARLPRNLRGNGRAVLIEILFRARRNTEWYEGVHLERGQFVFGFEALGGACDLSFQETRTIISWFKKVEFLTTKSTNAGSIGTIKEIDVYIKDKNQTNKQSIKQLTNSQQTANNIPKDKGIKDKNIYVSKHPTEAAKALRLWEKHAPLPTSANPDHCLAVLDDLHRIDKIPWEGDTGIYAICIFAAQHWVPNGYIGSPTALRKWTQAGDMKKYESIQQQIAAKGPKNHPGGQSKPVEYQIAFPDGKPITEYEKRLLRILHNEWTTDPDQGHVFTISDDNIVRAKAEGVESFLRGRQPEKGEEHAA